jgi:Fe-S-cluster containining protein
MQYVPWRNLVDWRCKACGYCCKLYSVVLGFPDWLKITKAFGAQSTVSDMERFYIKRVSDGSCAFLCNNSLNYFCGLQNMKPEACKLWPFKVLSEPKYGEEKQAVYTYGKAYLYVYADSMCNGLIYGAPNWDFEHIKVKEFIELSLGIRQEQHKTTRKADITPPQWGRKLFP